MTILLFLYAPPLQLDAVSFHLLFAYKMMLMLLLCLREQCFDHYSCQILYFYLCFDVPVVFFCVYNCRMPVLSQKTMLYFCGLVDQCFARFDERIFY